MPRPPVSPALLSALAPLLTVLLFPVAAPTARAGVIRHDRPDALYTGLATDPAFAPVGVIRIPTPGGVGFATGTLITPEFILTAAHVVAAANPSFGLPTFTIGAETFTAAAGGLVTFPDYLRGPNPGFLGGADVALIRLAAPVKRIAPAPLLGRPLPMKTEVTYVGYGMTGTGLTGERYGTIGVKRAGRNVIDAAGDGRPVGEAGFAFGPGALLADFDNPLRPPPDAKDNTLGSAFPLNLEYCIAPGDSGGPVFALEGGVLAIAAVNSFTYGANDRGADATYGDITGAAAVYPALDWIAAEIAAAAPFNPGSPGGAGEGQGDFRGLRIIPAPATLTLLAAGLLLIPRRRPVPRRRA